MLVAFVAPTSVLSILDSKVVINQQEGQQVLYPWATWPYLRVPGRAGPDIRPFSISSGILDIEIIRPDIQYFNILYLTTKSPWSNWQNHNFLYSWYYSNKLVPIHTYWWTYRQTYSTYGRLDGHDLHTKYIWIIL